MERKHVSCWHEETNVAVSLIHIQSLTSSCCLTPWLFKFNPHYESAWTLTLKFLFPLWGCENYSEARTAVCYSLFSTYFMLPPHVAKVGNVPVPPTAASETLCTNIIVSSVQIHNFKGLNTDFVHALQNFLTFSPAFFILSECECENELIPKPAALCN